MRKKSRKLLAVISLTLVTAMLTACGGKDGGNSAGGDNAAKGDASVSTDGVTELTFFGFKTSTQAEILEELVKEFNEQTSDIHVTYEGISMTGGYTDVLSSRLASGQGDDVFLINVNDVVAMSKTGYCEDLSDLPANQKTITSMEIDGSVPAFALSMPVIGIYANDAVLEAAGISEIPKTYNEFMAACETIKNAGYMPIVGGSKEGTCSSGFVTSMGMYNSYFGDGNVADNLGAFDNGEASLGEAVKPGLEWAKEVMDKGYIDAEASIVQSQLVDALPVFAAGETAFYVMGSWAIGDIKEACPDMDISFSGFPVNEDGPILLNSLDVRVAMNADGKNKEAARKFVEFMTTTENADRFCTSDGSLSNLTDGSPELDPILDDALKQVQEGRVIPWTDTTYQNIAFWAIMQEYTPKVFAGEPIDSIMEGIDSTIAQTIALK